MEGSTKLWKVQQNYERFNKTMEGSTKLWKDLREIIWKVQQIDHTIHNGQMART